MFEILTIGSVGAGFALIIVVLAKLGAGSPDSLVGLYVRHDLPPRPRGVQESDLPPFVFRDATTFGTSAT